MSFQSLREFITKLKEEGQLVTVSHELYPEPDIRAYLRAACDMGDRAPAIIFDNIKGYKGFKLAGHVHGSWANHAIMLGMDKTASIREQFFRIDDLWDRLDQGELEWVDNPPCQEVVVESNINLYELLPLFRINANDGGFYLSKPCVVSRDPRDPGNLDKENVGCYRIQVQGPDTLGLQVANFHDFGVQITNAERMGVKIPVAISLGSPPFVSAMSTSALAYDQSEYKVASALMGEPLKLARCLGSNINVPAGSEIIIEGEVIPRQRFPEGPFGEYPGSYSGTRLQFRIQVHRVTHRKDHIFENIYVGRSWTEHDTLIGLWTSVPLYRQIKETMPEVKCVNAIYQHGQTVIVSTDLKTGGYGKTVAMRILSTPHGTVFAKNIIVVDSDIDPFNHNEVMWALSTRPRGAKDIFLIPNTPGSALIPGSEPPGMDSRLVIDATTPVPPDIGNKVIMCEKLDTTRQINELAELQNRAVRAL